MSFFGPERFSVLVASPRRGLATFNVQMSYLATLLKCRITQNIQDRRPGFIARGMHVCFHILSARLYRWFLLPPHGPQSLPSGTWNPARAHPRSPASGPLSFPFPLHSPFSFTFLFCLFWSFLSSAKYF